MIILLFIIMVLITAFNYKINKNVLVPSFILCFSFLFSSGIYVICIGTVKDDISPDTIIVIILSLFMYMLGEIIMMGILNKGHLIVGYNNYFFEYKKDKLEISNIALFFFSTIILVLAYMRFVALCMVAGVSASPAVFVESYGQIRFYIIHGATLGLPRYISFISVIAPCIARICVTIISYNFLQCKKLCWRYLPVFICYFIYLFTTTSRTVYLEFILYVIVQFLFLRMFLLNKPPVINKETLKPVLIAIVVFCFIFFGVGALVKKSSTILQTLFGYTAAGLIGLTQFLENPYCANSFIESRTLQGLFSPLRIFGLELPELDSYLPHFYYTNGTVTSNEYTALMEPIHDFGLVGMLLTRCLLGMIIYAIYQRIINEGTRDRSYCCITIFAPLYYALFSASIDDQFSTFIGMYYVYQIIFTFLIWKFLVKRYETNDIL